MMLRKLIREGNISLSSGAKTKDAVIREASELLARVPGIQAIGAEAIRKALEQRESIGSTGIGDGVAIPHTTDDRLVDFYMAVITVPDGVDFDSIDRKPVRVIFAMIGPAAKRSDHVRILAALSRLSKKHGFLDSLISASSPEAVREMFDNDENAGDAGTPAVEKSLLLAMVQGPGYLEPLLEVLASAAGAGVMVMEGHGAGRYLHALPLFAMFWSDENRKDDIRLVAAVIDRHMGNDIVRRISTTVADPARDHGLIVALQDLSFASGSLDF